ncbi:hypothetical protein Syun_004034 [Stephania yunnanensis]|uniref:Zinc finger, CCHC-type n=1 Tax=Stephania yunnanensis TaxID=152371 RepID=A0AAP0Q0D5_9MAGN
MRIIRMSTILRCCMYYACNYGSRTSKDMKLMEAYDMAATLKEMFQQQARQERFETVNNLHSRKMTEGASVTPHVLKMKGYVDQLDRLGFPISQELDTDLILNSLPESYSQFVMNYNMNNMEKSISELHSMLKTVEQNIKKPSSNVLMVQKGKRMKMKGKSKAKVAKAAAAPVAKPVEQVKPSLFLLQNTQKKRKEIVISAMHLDIGSEIANSIWKILRRKRVVRLPLHVFIRYRMWISHLYKCAGTHQK